jgi:dihydrofolate reductase
MRKLILWDLMTLDGMFNGAKSWDLSWHGDVYGPELEQLSLDQLKLVGALVFGRVTYEGMATYWTPATGEIADFMNNLPKIVFSRTLTKLDWNNSTLVKENAAAEMSRLKRQPGKDIFIFGSANLSSTFMRAGLIDEFRICLTPHVLGEGSPLFKPSPVRMKMKLMKSTTLKSGCVILTYQPES